MATLKRVYQKGLFENVQINEGMVWRLVKGVIKTGATVGAAAGGLVGGAVYGVGKGLKHAFKSKGELGADEPEVEAKPKPVAQVTPKVKPKPVAAPAPNLAVPKKKGVIPPKKPVSTVPPKKP
jgi:hypothetical protein